MTVCFGWQISIRNQHSKSGISARHVHTLRNLFNMAMIGWCLWYAICSRYQVGITNTLCGCPVSNRLIQTHQHTVPHSHWQPLEVATQLSAAWTNCVRIEAARFNRAAGTLRFNRFYDLKRILFAFWFVLGVFMMYDLFGLQTFEC